MRKREFSSAALYSESSAELVELRCPLMAVRLKLRIKVDERSSKPYPFLIVVMRRPLRNCLFQLIWREDLISGLPHHASEVTLDTAGGPLRAWIFPGAAKISVLTEGAESREAPT